MLDIDEVGCHLWMLRMNRKILTNEVRQSGILKLKFSDPLFQVGDPSTYLIMVINYKHNVTTIMGYSHRWLQTDPFLEMLNP